MRSDLVPETQLVEKKSVTPSPKVSGGEVKSTLSEAGVLFKPKGPNYTIRMLLGKVASEDKEIPKLKDFSHFTLGCTNENLITEMTEALEELAAYFKGPVTFKPEAVINLRSETELPLWGIRLNLGPKETEIRAIFSKLFDRNMSPERDGNLYLWHENEKSQKKCPHLTIGSSEKDLEIANKLLKCKLTFDQIDYKPVGPHTLKSIKLESKNHLSLTM